MKQPKLYYFMINSHHHLISRIDKDTYGIFDICTIRYTEERFKTLAKALKFAESRGYKVKTFNTYSELFQEALSKEQSYDVWDVWQEKDLIEREAFHNQTKVNEIRKQLKAGTKMIYTVNPGK